MLMEINADQYLFSLYQSLTPFLFVLVITCCFHSFFCMLQASEFRSTVTCKTSIFIRGVNHTVENTTLVLLIKCKYRIPSKSPIKYFRICVFSTGPSKELLIQNFETCQYHYRQCRSHVTNPCHPRSHYYLVFSSWNHYISYQYKHNNNALADYCSTYLHTYLPTYLPTII